MIKFGQEVKDIVTGFKGIVTARIEFINGCVQYLVKPKMKTKDGKMPDGEYIDQQKLKIIGKGINKKKKKVGGIMKETPQGIGRAKK